MRRSRHTYWWPTPADFNALHMEADFCAEHEWGIETLRTAFGMLALEPETAGLDRHRIQGLPYGLVWHHRPRSRYAFLRFEPWASREPTVHGRETSIGRREEIAGAWSGGSFQVVAQTPESRANLTQLRDAFIAMDVAILMGGGNDNPFHRPGLTIAIASRVPESIRSALRDDDLRRLALAPAGAPGRV